MELMWVLDDDVDGSGWAFGGSVEGWCGWYPSAWLEKPFREEDALEPLDVEEDWSGYNMTYDYSGNSEGKIFEAIACAAFVGATDVELSFDEGATLEVMDLSDDVWWFGALRVENPQDEGGTMRQGYFPSAFVYITRILQSQSTCTTAAGMHYNTSSA